MQLFENFGGNRNLCSWNTMIMDLAIHGRCNEALKLFNQLVISFSEYITQITMF